jgi:Na+-transporting methylmalonyl-CoA/oxaloacetate decarboxylase gamma subunit
MEFSFLDALRTSIVAMIIVFSLLVILQYIIKLQSFILNFEINKGKTKEIDTIHSEELVVDEIEDDLAIVAVIAAALSVYLDIPQSNLKIKRIKRVSNNWS